MGRSSEQSVVITITSVICAVGWLLMTVRTPLVISFNSDRQVICYELNSATSRSLERSLDSVTSGVVLKFLEDGRPSETRVFVYVTPAQRRQVDGVVRKHDPAAESEVILANRPHEPIIQSVLYSIFNKSSL